MKSSNNNKEKDFNWIQNSLIELENFIIKLVNEKNTLQLKYHKILNMNSKLTQGESLDTSYIENFKKMNEQIFDLTDENKYLKEQLEIYNNSNNKDSKRIEGLSTVKLMKSTEREDFSAMSNGRKLEVTRKEILKDIRSKSKPLCKIKI